jgi:hypothetical protein
MIKIQTSSDQNYNIMDSENFEPMMSWATRFHPSRFGLGVFFCFVLVATQFTFSEASTAQTKCKLTTIKPNQIYTEQGSQLLNDIVSCKLTQNEIDVILQSLGYKRDLNHADSMHYFRYFEFGETQPYMLEICKPQFFGCFLNDYYTAIRNTI